MISDAEFYQREFVERPIQIVCPEKGVNEPWLPSMSRRLWNAGYSDQEIFGLLYKATRGVQHRTITEAEIKRAIERIVGTPCPNLNVNGKAKTRPVYRPEKLAERAARIPDTIDEAYLETRSQFTCHNRSPAGFLHKLYRPGEKVWLTTNEKSGDGQLWTHTAETQRFDELDHLKAGQPGVWFLTNPISGELHALARCKSKSNPEGLSFTTLECTTAWRYGLIESDEAPRDLWLKALVQILLPIVAVYDSGKRSVHTLVRFDAQTKEQLAGLLDRYETELVELGACPGSLTPRRLSRLPNCRRGETNQLQKLLYLRPDADNTPICRIPPRESRETVSERMRIAALVPPDL